MASITYLIPMPAGKADQFRKFSREALSNRGHQHRSSRGRHGYKKEKAWIHKTPAGEMLVVYLEGKMPEANDAFMKSQEPFDVWMRQELLGALSIDLEKGMPAEGELVFDYEAD